MSQPETSGTRLSPEEAGRLRQYVVMLREGTWFSAEQAADFRALADRLVEARPEESGTVTLRAIAAFVQAVCGTPGPRASQFWIYDGDRRPVIVEASARAEAVEAVRRSPFYDGFGTTVVPVKLFARYCRGEITEPEMYRLAQGEAA